MRQRAKARVPAGFVVGRRARQRISAVVSSHAIGLPQAYALGQAVAQIPDRLVVLCVDVVDTDYGVGLTPAVAAAVPAAVEAILAELADEDLTRSMNPREFTRDGPHLRCS